MEFEDAGGVVRAGRCELVGGGGSYYFDATASIDERWVVRLAQDSTTYSDPSCGVVADTSAVTSLGFMRESPGGRATMWAWTSADAGYTIDYDVSRTPTDLVLTMTSCLPVGCASDIPDRMRLTVRP